MEMNETNELLRQILKWQKLQGYQTLRILLPKLLNTDKKRQVFELTDGKMSTTEISKQVGVALGTVSNWWQSWHALGVLEKVGRQYTKPISLKDINLDEVDG